MSSKLIVVALAAALAAVALMMAGLGIKTLVKKRGEFKRHCSGMDPYTGEGAGCVCGKAAGARCSNKAHSPLEVNEEMMKEL